MKRKALPKKREKTAFDYFVEHLYRLNSSKFFTGLVMLTVNIGSKYITLQLSSSQEEYIKYTLGRQILVFAILWMGTRDIVTALILTCVFIIFADYLFNDNSKFCIIPHSYMEKVKDKENPQITQKEVDDAIHLLKRAREQKQTKATKSEDKDFYIKKGLYKENFI
tara:strand:- start:1325 stop:1822 length:498 start_codon:yes stop_codon:yes gene_type:complete